MDSGQRCWKDVHLCTHLSCMRPVVRAIVNARKASVSWMEVQLATLTTRQATSTEAVHGTKACSRMCERTGCSYHPHVRGSPHGAHEPLMFSLAADQLMRRCGCTAGILVWKWVRGSLRVHAQWTNGVQIPRVPGLARNPFQLQASLYAIRWAHRLPLGHARSVQCGIEVAADEETRLYTAQHLYLPKQSHNRQPKAHNLRLTAAGGHPHLGAWPAAEAGHSGEGPAYR
eukprot:345483-Chlamydomonas_euryale.AAC.8